MNANKVKLEAKTLIFLVSIFFYWTEYQFIGLSFLFLLALINIVKHGRITKSPQTFWLIAIIITSSVIGLISLKTNINLKSFYTAVHAIAIIISISNIGINICTITLNFFLKYFSIISLTFTLSIFFESKSFFYYLHESGYQRYKFLLSEPSYLGLYSSYLLFLYMTRIKKWKSINYIQFLTITLLIFTTQSGSAVFMLALSIILASSWKNKFTTITKNHVKVFFYGIAIVSSILIFSPFFDNFLTKRITDTFSGSVDRSSELRFGSPILLSQYTLDNFPLLGVGFGLHKDYITDNYSNFLHMTKVNEQGEIIKNTNIDNGWVFILFNSGIIGLILILYIYIHCAIKNRSSTSIYIYGFFLLFFTGSFISPLFLSLFSPKIYSQPINSN